MKVLSLVIYLWFFVSSIICVYIQNIHVTAYICLIYLYIDIYNLYQLHRYQTSYFRWQNLYLIWNLQLRWWLVYLEFFELRGLLKFFVFQAFVLFQVENSYIWTESLSALTRIDWSGLENWLDSRSSKEQKAEFRVAGWREVCWMWAHGVWTCSPNPRVLEQVAPLQARRREL